MPSTWKFVDQPALVHATLLDMNDGDTWRTLGEDFDISPPPVTRSLVRNAMIDGGILTSASFDLRELRFTLRLEGVTENERVMQLKAFESEVAKPGNLLMYQSQLHDTPVFFRTLRSDSFELDTQFVPGKVWQIKAVVAAEPYAIGVRRDLDPITVANDPAAASNPTMFDVPGPILGDGPTPAFVRISTLAAGETVLLAQRTINNPTALTNFAQAEDGVLEGGTVAYGPAADFSGSDVGNNATAVVFSDEDVIRRLTVTVPTATSAEALRGRYRVILRTYLSDSATDPCTFLIRYQQAGVNGNPGPTVTVTLQPGEFQLVDLGVMEHPHATTAPSAIGYSALPPGFSAGELEIWAGRIDGAFNLDMDYVYLLPADERLCSVQTVAATGFLVLDGPNDATYGMAAGTTPFGLTRTIDGGGGLVPRIGGLPMLVPGVNNRWYMLTGGGDIAATKTVEISYWPRWLDVATD